VGRVTVPTPTDLCPCGSGRLYDGCCGLLHRGQESARTARELMRSRYSAYVVGDADYVLRTWHPRTRPDGLDLGRAPKWQGLTLISSSDGREGDGSGEVEFRADFRGGSLHERSRFVRRAGRWVYVDGDDLG
jgi:SEC-C motif-containing protein